MFALIGIGLGGCTSIQVKNANGFQPQAVKQLCLIKNPAVVINGFEDSVIRSLGRYNINATLYPANSSPSNCQTTMDYTALRTWDIVPYMSYSKLTLKQNGRIVSDAEFKLKGKGGLALNKWRSTDKKVDELVDVLVGKAVAK